MQYTGCERAVTVRIELSNCGSLRCWVPVSLLILTQPLRVASCQLMAVLFVNFRGNEVIDMAGKKAFAEIALSDHSPCTLTRQLFILNIERDEGSPGGSRARTKGKKDIIREDVDLLWVPRAIFLDMKQGHGR